MLTAPRAAPHAQPAEVHEYFAFITTVPDGEAFWVMPAKIKPLSAVCAQRRDLLERMRPVAGEWSRRTGHGLRLVRFHGRTDVTAAELAAPRMHPETPLRIPQLYLYVLGLPEGEGVPSTTMPDQPDVQAPMVGADLRMMDLWRPYAQLIAAACGLPLSLIRLTEREELERWNSN